MIEQHHEAIRDLVLNYGNRITLFFLRRNILKFCPDLQGHSQILFLEDYLNVGNPFIGNGEKLTTGSYACLFAAMLGYRKMHLLGIDQNLVEKIPEAKHVGGHILEITETPKHNPNYFIDDYQQKGEKYNIPNSLPNLHYESWILVKERLDRFGIRVLNCSEESRLDIFDFYKNNLTPEKKQRKKIENEQTMKKSNRLYEKIYVFTTLDEIAVTEYSEMIKSLRQNSKDLLNDLNVIALAGNTITEKSLIELRRLADVTKKFSELQSYRYFKKKYDKNIYHPLGKFAKLFFMRDFIEKKCHPDDVVIFLDPDVIVQRHLRDFINLVQENVVLFGHEIDLTHYVHKKNARLCRAKIFDKSNGYLATYITEINTGVNLSYAKSFCKLINDFEIFVKESKYFEHLDSIPDGNKWHDQDFFRYFYRKNLRADIGTLKFDYIFTTTRIANKCIFFNKSKNKYITIWGEMPYIVHFAGGTRNQIQRLDSEQLLLNNPIDENSLKENCNEHLKHPNVDLRKDHSTAHTSKPIVDPQYVPDMIYYRSGTQLLVKRFIEGIASDRKINLFVDKEGANEIDHLFKNHPKVNNIILSPESFENEADMNYFINSLTSMKNANSIAIPLTEEFKSLEFLKGGIIPDISSIYKVVKTFWKFGIRYFTFTSFAGDKTFHIPYLLDAFRNIHKNQRCFVVGNGPSLNQIDMGRLRNEITFGSNRCYLGYDKWGYDFTYWGIMDRLQIEEYNLEYEKNIPDQTIKFFPFEYLPILNFKNSCPVNFSYDGRPPYKFSGNPEKLHLGFTVTHMLLQIAAVMGCNPIYLIGCDHHYNLNINEEQEKTYGAKNAKIWVAKDATSSTHFTNKYTSGEQKKFITPKPEKMEKAFEVAYNVCNQNKIKIFNATPNTGLKSFPKISFDAVFNNTSDTYKLHDNIKYGISHATVNESKIVIIRGWILSFLSINKIEIKLDGQYAGDANINIGRVDIFQQYPEFENRNSGFEFIGRNVDVHNYPKRYQINVYNNDKLLKEISGTINYDDNLINLRFVNDLNLLNLKDKHKNQRCFIIGNGPSLTIKDLEMLKNEITFASNRIYLCFNETDWRPTYLTICDAIVGRDNIEQIKNLKIKKIFSDSVRKYYEDDLFAVFLNPPQKSDERNAWNDLINIARYSSNHVSYHNDDKKTFELVSKLNITAKIEFLKDDISFPLNWNFIRGARAGHSVISLGLKAAYWMGFSEVYIIGCDHSFTIPDTKTGKKIHNNDEIVSEGEVNHFHPEYRKKGESWTFPQLDIMEAEFEYAKKVFDADNRKIFNASRYTKIKCWDKVSIDSLIENNFMLDPYNTDNFMFSVILANYNGEKYLDQAIDSVLNQADKNFEFIIIDDGSTDKSKDIILRYASQHPKNIKYFFQQKNQGQASGFNLGINMSQGKVVTFIDSDDIWMKDKLSKLRTLISKNPNGALYQHNLYFIRKDKYTNEAFRDFLKSGNLFAEAICHKEVGGFTPTTGLAVPRSVLHNILPIPLQFKTCADGYLTRTAFCFGSVVSTNESLGYYRVHDENATFQNKDFSERNHFFALKQALESFYKSYDIPLEYSVPQNFLTKPPPPGTTAKAATTRNNEYSQCITTLCIGQNYLRMGVAMMKSCRIFLNDSVDYIIFYLNCDPLQFFNCDWIKFIKIEEIYPLNNKFSARRYKYIPIYHHAITNYDVLFLDADTLVFDNIFNTLFERIFNHSVLIYGTYQNIDYNWYSQVKGFEKFNLKNEAYKLGWNINNLSLNSGIIGRKADRFGYQFAQKIYELLYELPLPHFSLSKYKAGEYFNDEPYFALAYELICGQLSDLGYLLKDRREYVVTTNNAYIEESTDAEQLNKNPIVNKGGVSSKSAIIHFVGYERFPFYQNKVDELLKCD
jgi:glycosyltransferase involved in cell wall biosynthesis